MMDKFKQGDRVINKHNAKGIVIRTEGQTIHVRLDGGLETTFEQDELKFHYDLSEEKRIDNKHVGENCPKCGTPWSVAHFTKGAVYHCKPCNKKAADLLVYQPPKMPWDSKSSKSDDDLLKEFEAMLDDDSDDWFTFLKDMTVATRVHYAQELIERGLIKTPEDYIKIIRR